ncbi:MAG: hypothetical protein IKT60_05780 [Clostridia bacterium]|nr:hypothetical protein [Clostridia bacterium]
MKIGAMVERVRLGFRGGVEKAASLAAAGYDGFLTIERECGATPEADITLAVNFLREKLAKYNIG